MKKCDFPPLPERIVMTPKKKTANSTTLMMERKAVSLPKKSGDHGGLHVAGGSNAGIVVNKQQVNGEGERKSIWTISRS